LWGSKVNITWYPALNLDIEKDAYSPALPYKSVKYSLSLFISYSVIL
jgi:hypothetical protein